MDIMRLNDNDVPERKHGDPISEHTTGQSESPHDLSQNSSALASLPRLRKNLLYTTISLALAIDMFATWGLFPPLDLVARDLGLAEGGNAVWIVSAYAMAFAACIPLGGRLCDVFPAQGWFVGGFAGMAGLSLGLSFSGSSAAHEAVPGDVDDFFAQSTNGKRFWRFVPCRASAGL
jgi:MFS family permease